MKIAVPDLVSPSYFLAEAAVVLGFCGQEGLAVELELISPIEAAYAALRSGEVDFVAGSAHSVLSAFPGWSGAKLVCAQSQGMYWFLVLKAALQVARGDLERVKGLRIGAAPWVGLGLKGLLRAAGIDPERDGVKIAPMPGSLGRHVNFGVAAARALEEGLIDGFWANGMGAEIVSRAGLGTIVLDVRRGDGPKEAFNYTMPTIAATQRLIDGNPQAVAAVVRAIAAAQKELIARPQRAAEVGRALFPGEADLIVDLVRRDLPWCQSRLTPQFIAGMNRFACDVGILDAPRPYETVVATQFASLWT